MTLLSPNHNHAADECIAQIPQHHIPTQEEKVRASESFDKSVLVAAHMAALHDAYILEMATHPVNEVNIKPASPTSTIGGLKPSTLKQLKIGKVHRRRVVKGSLCSKTLCTKSHNGLMVVNVFEDEEGNATPIYLSNAMEGNGGSAQAQRCYPQDSKVAVKEPYLTRLPDGEVVLLVEKMTDLIFLWVPEYVEENGGSKGSGMYKDGREVFAMEKEGEEDGVPESDPKGVDNGNVSEDAVTDEDVKSSSASRELKFDDLLGAKGKVGASTAEDDEKVQDSTTLDAKGEVDISKTEDDEKVQAITTSGPVAEEGAGDLGGNDKSDLEVGSLKTEDDEKVPVSTTLDAGEVDSSKTEVDEKVQDNTILGPVAEAGVGDAGGNDRTEDQVTEEAKTDEISRELSMEDNLLMRKNAGDNGEVKDADGEVDKALEMNGEESKGVADVDGGHVHVKQEGQQAKPAGDADAGETAASMRVKGNALFARGEYNKATDIYRRAVEKARLDKLKNEEVLCLSNRAEVWLRLCRNQAALDDAEAALKILREEEEDANKGNLALAKALFRKGRALMGLHKYDDAMRVLQEVLAKAPADRQLREAAAKCRDHLQRVMKPGKRQRAAMNRKKSASFMTQ